MTIKKSRAGHTLGQLASDKLLEIERSLLVFLGTA